MRFQAETSECLGQFQAGYAQRQSNSNLTFHGERLQSDGPIRTAEKHIGAYPDAKRDVAAGAHIDASQSTDRWTTGWCEHAPSQYTAGGDSDIKPDRVEFTDIDLLLIPSVGKEAASHRLARADDEADARRYLAGQHADLRARRRRLSNRRRQQCQRRCCGDRYDAMLKHGHL